jgi:type IV pilus assembly protein PilN
MIKINLLPYRAERKKELIVQQCIIGIVPLVLAVIIVSILWISLSSDITAAEKDIQKVKQEIEQCKIKLKEIDDYKKNKEILTKKMDVINKLQKGKNGPVHLVDELSTCLPGGLWLTAVKQKGMSLEITGKALDNIAISNYMINLGKSVFFEGVDLKQVKTESQEFSKKGVQIKTFVITCTVVYSTDKKAQS